MHKNLPVSGESAVILTTQILQFGYIFTKTPVGRVKTVDNPADLEYIIIVVVCITQALGNTAQRLCVYCAVRFYVSLYNEELLTEAIAFSSQQLATQGWSVGQPLWHCVPPPPQGETRLARTNCARLRKRCKQDTCKIQ